MEREEILAEIQRADLILVGLGEEFNDSGRLKDCKEYTQGREVLRETGYHWLVPAWSEYCSAKLGKDIIKPALEKLAGLLEDKDYFVVATATDSRITEIPWKNGNLVMPCGTVRKKQCVRGCEDVWEDKIFAELYAGNLSEDLIGSLGKCPQCGGAMILNNVYGEGYNEQGYMAQWQVYTKWLQGTLKRGLLVLELGVGMQFPTVIRWPFEKVVFFNQRASFIRVNEKLYQLTDELVGKGCGIHQNSIDWLEIL